MDQNPHGPMGCPPFLAALGAYRDVLVVFWGFLGALWGVLGKSGGVLGGVLAASWGVLGVSWGALGASLGASWGVPGRLGGILGLISEQKEGKLRHYILDGIFCLLDFFMDS